MAVAAVAPMYQVSGDGKHRARFRDSVAECSPRIRVAVMLDRVHRAAMANENGRHPGLFAHGTSPPRNLEIHSAGYRHVLQRIAYFPCVCARCLPGFARSCTAVRAYPICTPWLYRSIVEVCFSW